MWCLQHKTAIVIRIVYVAKPKKEEKCLGDLIWWLSTAVWQRSKRENESFSFRFYFEHLTILLEFLVIYFVVIFLSFSFSLGLHASPSSNKPFIVAICQIYSGHYMISSLFFFCAQSNCITFIEKSKSMQRGSFIYLLSMYNGWLLFVVEAFVEARFCLRSIFARAHQFQVYIDNWGFIQFQMHCHLFQSQIFLSYFFFVVVRSVLYKLSIIVNQLRVTHSQCVNIRIVYDSVCLKCYLKRRHISPENNALLLSISSVAAFWFICQKKITRKQCELKTWYITFISAKTYFNVSPHFSTRKKNKNEKWKNPPPHFNAADQRDCDCKNEISTIVECAVQKL